MPVVTTQRVRFMTHFSAPEQRTDSKLPAVPTPGADIGASALLGSTSDEHDFWDGPAIREEIDPSSAVDQAGFAPSPRRRAIARVLFFAIGGGACAVLVAALLHFRIV